MARKFTFKKTIDLSSPALDDDKNQPALITSLKTATTTKKQPPPNIFQQQSVANSSNLPFKKQLPSSNITSTPSIDHLSLKENNFNKPSPKVNKAGQSTLNHFFELKQSPASNNSFQQHNNSATKPTATILPQKQFEYKKTNLGNETKQSTVKTSLFTNHFNQDSNAIKQPVVELPVKKNEPREPVDDPLKCNSCQVSYDLNPKSKSQNRKIIDNCGHAICFACLLAERACLICEFVNKNNQSSANESYKEVEEEEPAKQEKSINNSTLDAIIQDDDFDRTNSPIIAAPIPAKPQQIQPTKNDSFRFSLDNEIDDLIEIRPLTTTKLKSTAKSPIRPKDTIYLDSDGESGVVLIKSDDEFYSSIPIIKDKIKPTGKKTILNDCYDDEIESLEATVSKPKGIITADDYYDDEFDIQDVDFGDCPKPKPSIPIIKQNTHVSESSKNQAVAATTAINSIIDIYDKLENKHGVAITELSKYAKIKWLFNDIKDSSPHYHRLDYPHSDDMLITFRNLFGLRQFRPQQFEAVNAALTGSNCFVLMPTGGGKSLCYQLPACLDRGLTLVVSPLKSLIIDQVDKLNSLNITAAHLLADKEDEDSSSSNSNFVYQDLSRQEPTLKLLYLTPEKLNLSGKLTKILTSLYNRNLIARLVIDEAHCVSNWGHDFRKDYTQLGALRNRLFPNVPVMLLTATATPRVRKDILIQMSLSCNEDLFQNKLMNENSNSKLTNKLANRSYVIGAGLNSMTGAQRQNCAFFIQSFNRENLQYKVEYKTSNAAALEKIVTIIKQKYSNKSGIVYCISRNECETVSSYLKKNGLKSLPYHAGMNDKDRQSVQHKWSNTNDCKVVCATIAFGMGIDKADVRYVFHLGLPKSLEGYYQESGRAGRDGQTSLCYLFFNNQDRQKWLGLMKREQQTNRGDYAVFKVHVDNLYRMSQYCDNNTDCRRAQILEYFGEIFDRTTCIESKMNTACDNCLTLKANAFTLRDITAEAISICRGVQQICVKEDVTLLHISEVLKGSKNAKVMEKNHQNLEMHGKLAGYKKNDIERIIRRLIFTGYLSEEVKVITYTDTVACYIKLGPKASLLTRDKVTEKIEFDFVGGGEATKSRYTFDNNTNDDDEDEYFGNDLDETELNKTSKQSTKTSSQEKALKTRCATELKALAKEVCTQSNSKVETIFPRKLLNEMLLKMPINKELFINLEYYTEAKFNNFQGERFLNIFRHYKRLLDELKEDELMSKALEAEKAAVASSKIKSKAYAPSSGFTEASLKNSKTYGLVDNEENNTYTSSAPSKWQNSSQYKRKSSSFAKPYKSKKAKTSHGDGSFSTGASTSSSLGSSTYFKAKGKFGNKKSWGSKFKKSA